MLVSVDSLEKLVLVDLLATLVQLVLSELLACQALTVFKVLASMFSLQLRLTFEWFNAVMENFKC